MAFSLSQVDRKARTYNVTTLLNGATVPPSGSVGLGLVPKYAQSPTAATVWTPVTYTSGSFSVLFAGPQADSTGAIVVTADADLWMLETDAPLVQAVKIERITVLGSSAVLPSLPSTYVTSVNGKSGVAALTFSDVGAASTTDSRLSDARAATDASVAALVGNGASAATIALRAAFAAVLTPTATKTTTYTAAVGDLAMMNVAGGGATLTLPAAPANKSLVGYRAIGATPAAPLTVNRGGSTDTIGTTGATSVTLPMADEIAVLQYDAANTRWLAVSAVKTQASLDLRYGRADPTLASFSYDAATGNLLSYQEDGITITMTYNADGTVATSKRGTDATQTYSYTGGNLTGVA